MSMKYRTAHARTVCSQDKKCKLSQFGAYPPPKLNHSLQHMREEINTYNPREQSVTSEQNQAAH